MVRIRWTQLLPVAYQEDCFEEFEMAQMVQMAYESQSITESAGRGLRDLADIVSEQERRCERTTLLAHSRQSAPRGRSTRLTRTSGPMGVVVRVEPGKDLYWRVVVEYQTVELRHWVTEQLRLLEASNGR